MKTCGDTNLERTDLRWLNPGDCLVGFGISLGLRTQPFHLFAFQVSPEGIRRETLENYGRSGRSSGVKMSLGNENFVVASWDGGCLENRIDGERGKLTGEIEVYQSSLCLFRCSEAAFQDLQVFILGNE